MKVLIMSDIHGNREALASVLDSAREFSDIEACILLGDVIDYGMHSNEAIKMLKALPYPVLCNIRGNHEDAVINERYERFSSDRGRESARYTRSALNSESWDYLQNTMEPSGIKAFEADGKKCLAVHGSLADEYWKSIQPEQDAGGYEQYDYVFSGHSHLPHFVEKYIAVQDAERRNKKKVSFINPGSVGQPRNLNSCAQYAVLDFDTGQLWFQKAVYDIAAEQAAYHGQVDQFYCERLKWGV